VPLSVGETEPETHWFGQSPSALQSGYPRLQLPGSLQSGKPGHDPIDWQSVARSCTRFASEDSQLPSAAIGVTGVLAAQRQQEGLPVPLPSPLALPSPSISSTATIAKRMRSLMSAGSLSTNHARCAS
jgi:hypothetical protein